VVDAAVDTHCCRTVTVLLNEPASFAFHRLYLHPVTYLDEMSCDSNQFVFGHGNALLYCFNKKRARQLAAGLNIKLFVAEFRRFASNRM
jgi:hypothetical protein